MRPSFAAAVAMLLAGCGDRVPSGASAMEAQPPETAELVAPRDAIRGAYVPELDPHTLNDAEIAKALPSGYDCVFRYTSSGQPVVVTSTADGGMAALKLNGKLVLLRGASSPQEAAGHGPAYADEGVRIGITPAGDGDLRAVQKQRSAQLIVEIDPSLRVGYGGYYACPRRRTPST